MPRYTFECKCGESIEQDREITNRDVAPILACKNCNSDQHWTRRHCESKNLKTDWKGSHSLEYNKTGRRKGV